MKRFVFNVHAELFENDTGELAIRFADGHVYGHVGERQESRFVTDVKQLLQSGETPADWSELPAQHLVYDRRWHIVSRLGYVNENPERVAGELEVSEDQLGTRARTYLGELVQ